MTRYLLVLMPSFLCVVGPALLPAGTAAASRRTLTAGDAAKSRESLPIERARAFTDTDGSGPQNVTCGRPAAVTFPARASSYQ